MTTTDIYRRLTELLPSAAQLHAYVQLQHMDGMATVTYPGGGTARVRNPFGYAQGTAVYVQADAIVGTAPDLGPPVRIEI